MGEQVIWQGQDEVEGEDGVDAGEEMSSCQEALSP